MLEGKIFTSSMLFFHFRLGLPLSECNRAAQGPRFPPQTYGLVNRAPWFAVREPCYLVREPGSVLAAPGARARIASNLSQRSARQGPRSQGIPHGV